MFSAYSGGGRSGEEEEKGKSQAKPMAPFYRADGDGVAERKEWERNKMMAEEEEEAGGGEEEEEEARYRRRMGLSVQPSLSDSLIPQVGDSLWERNEEIEDKELAEEKTEEKQAVGENDD